MNFRFERLRKETGNWDSFLADWKSQCDDFEEEFETYERSVISAVRDLAEGPRKADAAVFALHDGQRYCAMSQVNVAALPGYQGPVLRVRFMQLSPYYEMGNYIIDKYIEIITHIFFEIVQVSDGEMPSQHIKFHLRMIHPH